MNNRININTIVVFEPDDYLSVTIKDIISDKYNTLYVHDEVSFNNTVNRVDDIDLIIVLDEKDRYDALDILNKYLDERWFIETMTLVLSKERDNIRMNKAYSTGVQDYIFIDDIIETDYKRTLELCIEHQIRLKNKIRHLRLFTNYDGLTGLYNQSVGEDMIIKDGKIISCGNVYLVGIELSNDMMFKVPPSKILNKALLNVLDFQQFDNIYDRVELLLDDSGITDYVVKPLALENIGTLKNMKYINFY